MTLDLGGIGQLLTGLVAAIVLIRLIRKERVDALRHIQTATTLQGIDNAVNHAEPGDATLRELVVQHIQTDEEKNDIVIARLKHQDEILDRIDRGEVT